MHSQKKDPSPFSPTIFIENIGDCDFYHVMEIPGHGVVEGQWDLRGSEAGYLGYVEFDKKRVLELGTASGFLCFHMENQGAEVVGFDLDDQYDWDIVPLQQYDYKEHLVRFKKHLKRLRKGFWFAHKAFTSQARMVYGTVYNIPETIGEFDICVVCAILLHIRDPFLALQNAAKMTRETIVVTDVLSQHPLIFPPKSRLRYLLSAPKRKLLGIKKRGYGPEPAYAEFLPNAATQEIKDAWWFLSPETVVRMLGVLGFEDSKVTYHSQKHSAGYPRDFFTVVAKRTQPNRLREIP